LWEAVGFGDLWGMTVTVRVAWARVGDCVAARGVPTNELLRMTVARRTHGQRLGLYYCCVLLERFWK
jgi:hypothetical protein